jgi:two-component system OmpR family response regulator
MRILLIEDDVATAAHVRDGLEEDGHDIEVAGDGDTGLASALAGRHDVLVVDRMLPGRDGLSLVAELRARGIAVPTLFLSTLAGIDDRVSGLEQGGDDYLVKPFALSELVARVNALGRRARDQRATRQHVGDLELDLLARTASWAGRELELNRREFELLSYLARHAGQLVTRKMLLEQVWGFHFDPRTTVVETHLSRLRGKLERAGIENPIVTVRGAGYTLFPSA